MCGLIDNASDRVDLPEPVGALLPEVSGYALPAKSVDEEKRRVGQVTGFPFALELAVACQFRQLLA